MWFDLLCKFAWKSFSIQEEFCELLSQICEVPATINRFLKKNLYFVERLYK